MHENSASSNSSGNGNSNTSRTAIDLTGGPNLNIGEEEEDPAVAVDFDPETMAEDIDFEANNGQQRDNEEVRIENDDVTSEVKGLGNVKKCVPNVLAINHNWRSLILRLLE